MPDRYGRVVIPVLSDVGGNVSHVGSALLVEGLNGSGWLVSAVHVLAQPVQSTIGVPWFRNAMRHLHGTVYTTSKLSWKDAQADQIDAAVIRLESSVIEDLRTTGACFLPFERLHRSNTVADCQCALTGYPEGSVEWDSNSLLSKTEMHRIHVMLYSNAETKKRGYEPKRHVIAKYGGTLADGSRHLLPKPNCMSGGTVWILNQETPEAAGIITTLISRNNYKRAIVCTRMAGVAQIIADPTKANIVMEH